jgi:peptidoglycan/LPS O-acetylase OafA/YrhL
MLRGIAVLLVLFFHFEGWIKFGWIGVDLFFVLSGYLVSTLLFKEFQKNRKVRPVRFLIRRGFKIYPMFFIMIIATVIARLAFGEPLRPGLLFFESTFLRNYFGGYWAHTWSLCVEEHFYFLLAMLAFLLCNKTQLINNRPAMNMSMISVLVLCLLFRFYSLYYEGIHGESHFFNAWARGVNTHSRIDSILFGVLIAYNHFFRKEKLERFIMTNKWLLRAVMLLLLSTGILLSVKPDFKTTFCYTLLYAGFGILLSDVLINISGTGELDSFRGRYLLRPLAFIGTSSYAIYLFHPLIRDYCVTHLVSGSLPGFLLYFGLSLLTGYLMTISVEKYFLKLRERHFPDVSSR